jgi:esterase/lipase superfamily enzyme
LAICITFVLVTLGGCAYRPGSEVLIPVASVPESTSKVDLLVATTRERGSKTDPDAFTAERAKQLNFAALTVSVPPQHTKGEIEWPSAGPADPRLHFVTTKRDFLKQ